MPGSSAFTFRSLLAAAWAVSQADSSTTMLFLPLIVPCPLSSQLTTCSRHLVEHLGYLRDWHPDEQRRTSAQPDLRSARPAGHQLGSRLAPVSQVMDLLVV